MVRAINDIRNQYDLKIIEFNLFTGEIISFDSIKNIPSSFRVVDLQIRKRKMIVMSYCQFIYKDLNKKESIEFRYPQYLTNRKDQNKFDRCEFINDTILLLNTIYKYHVLDGISGVYLITFNLNTLQFDKYRNLPFPGISISGVTNNWITILKNNIYIITPLSTKLYRLNFDLEIIDTTQIVVYSDSAYSANLEYEHISDSSYESERQKVSQKINKYPLDSQFYHSSEFESFVYSKDYLRKVFKDIQKLSFVSHIFSIDDSLIAVCSSLPDGKPKKGYRDLDFLDPAENKIKKNYHHLHAYFPADTLIQPEDFFYIPFEDKLHAPYCHNGYAYYYSLYPLSSFKAGALDDLALKLLNDSKKNGYKCSILKYKLK